MKGFCLNAGGYSSLPDLLRGDRTVDEQLQDDRKQSRHRLEAAQSQLRQGEQCQFASTGGIQMELVGYVIIPIHASTMDYA